MGDIFSLEDIEQSEKIDLIDFDKLDKLETTIQRNNITIIPPPKNIDRKPEFAPKVFRALLRRGSNLELIDTDQVYSTDREIFVKAQQSNHGDSYSYVLNKTGEWAYRTRTLNLNSVEDDVLLGFPNIKGNEHYVKSFRHNIQDKELQISQRFSLSLESIQAFLFEELFDNPGVSQATANRFEWRAFYKWHVPIQFGLSLAFQQGQYFDQAVTWDAFYFGPLIKYPLLKKDHMLTSLSMGVQKSTGFVALQDRKELHLTSLTWHIDVETRFKTRFGSWVVGIEYRDQNTGIDKDNIGLQQSSAKREKIKSLGFVIGREFEFTL